MPNQKLSKIYERCVAAWAIENFDFIDLTVTANAKIKGVISNRSRQIDVLLEDRYACNPNARVIVEAKLHGRPIDIEIIEAIEAKLRDVNASHAVIVSSEGFTKSAYRRSEENIDLTVLSYNELVDEYQDKFSNCISINNCGKELLWSIPKIDAYGPGWLMYKYGKCLKCHTFHILCLDCGAELPIKDGHIVNCDCEDREWGAIPESKKSGHIGKPESTWLMLKLNNELYGLQRKPIGHIK